MSKQVTLKVYYVENNATKEIRKFAIDEDLIGNFEYLIGKIRVVFPDLLRKDLQLFWKGKIILKLPFFKQSDCVCCSLVCCEFEMKPEASNYIEKETLAQMFFCEFCKIFKSTFFTAIFYPSCS